MTDLLPIDLHIYDEEETLLEGLRSHDKYACACMLKRYAGQVYALGLRMMSDEDEAEEVMQETFISACKNIDRFQGRSKLGTWLYRIATNAALMRLRRKKHTVPLDSVLNDSGLPLPETIVSWRNGLEDLAMQGDLHDALENGLTALSENLRATFVLRDIHGLSTAETAETLNISESAVKVRLHRARLQLREVLSKNPAISLEEYGIQP
ncbi:MAG: sigma-70 family RNA polymerase sigma factor [Caldilineaceae bacterium]|nr:sigma-70 family RNA polymerase sigma factor [Caldilineaceae bacterium]